MSLSLAIVALVGFYCLFVVYLIINWLRQKEPVLKSQNPVPIFSVIIPFRNEKENLPRLVRQLLRQNENGFLLEILLIDDHSEDDGAGEIKREFGSNEKVKFISLTENYGKKKAIEAGAAEASGKFLITLDADVEIGENWLSTIGNFCLSAKPVMVLMPVMFYGEKTLFDKLQTIEFLSLMGSTAATAAAGKPIMANGAGLVIKRSVFRELKGFDGNEKIASGDDVFLLFKVKKLFPADIYFLHHPDVIINTKPQPSLRAFCSQRLRWGGKAKSFSDSFALTTAFLVLLTNIALVLFFVLTISGTLHGWLFIVCFLLKSAADFLFLFLVAGFYKKRKLLWLFPLEAILYPIYIVVIGIAGIFVKPKWKGRKNN